MNFLNKLDKEAVNPIVIYHANCADGIAGAWCFEQAFGRNNVELHPGIYNATPPDVSNRTVYLVDFSYSREVVKEMIKVAHKVILIDHHETSLNNLKGLHGLDMANSCREFSGCVLAWHYTSNEPVPNALLTIQDRDLWKFEIPYTKELMAYFFSYELTTDLVNSFVAICNDSNVASGAIEMGRHFLRLHNKFVDQYIEQNSRLIQMAGYRVKMVNCAFNYASDVGSKLAEKELFGVTYYDTAKHRIFSLRSNGKVDVSAIAAAFGGGGHKKASGFKVDREHWLAQI